MKTAVKEAVVPSRPAPASLNGLSVSHLCVLNGTG